MIIYLFIYLFIPFIHSSIHSFIHSFSNGPILTRKKWTSNERPPVLRGHFCLAVRAVSQNRFYCILVYKIGIWDQKMRLKQGSSYMRVQKCTEVNGHWIADFRSWLGGRLICKVIRQDVKDWGRNNCIYDAIWCVVIGWLLHVPLCMCDPSLPVENQFNSVWHFFIQLTRSWHFRVSISLWVIPWAWLLSVCTRGTVVPYAPHFAIYEIYRPSASSLPVRELPCEVLFLEPHGHVFLIFILWLCPNN